MQMRQQAEAAEENRLQKSIYSQFWNSIRENNIVIHISNYRHLIANDNNKNHFMEMLAPKMKKEKIILCTVFLVAYGVLLWTL